MVKRILLADATYARLANRRRPGESLSQTIDRLLDGVGKNPERFVGGRRSELDPHVWIAQIEADRDGAAVGP